MHSLCCPARAHACVYVCVCVHRCVRVCERVCVRVCVGICAGREGRRLDDLFHLMCHTRAWEHARLVKACPVIVQGGILHWKDQREKETAMLPQLVSCT